MIISHQCVFIFMIYSTKTTPKTEMEMLEIVYTLRAHNNKKQMIVTGKIRRTKEEKNIVLYER